MWEELQMGAFVCTVILGGEDQVRLYYDVEGIRHFVVADCLTEDEIWEFGIEGRSSFDSIHQALFAAELTGRDPSVMIFMDGDAEGAEAFQIRTVATEAGVSYETMPSQGIVRQAQVDWLRRQSREAQGFPTR
ncbi:hypothetical protein [Hasllibacter halocynthiae]|nr:hypothetical protein [Hasllibacter halocynthiae]